MIFQSNNQFGRRGDMNEPFNIKLAWSKLSPSLQTQLGEAALMIAYIEHSRDFTDPDTVEGQHDVGAFEVACAEALDLLRKAFLASQIAAGPPPDLALFGIAGGRDV
jgi:hypothetical protein